MIPALGGFAPGASLIHGPEIDRQGRIERIGTASPVLPLEGPPVFRTKTRVRSDSPCGAVYAFGKRKPGRCPVAAGRWNVLLQLAFGSHHNVM